MSATVTVRPGWRMIRKGSMPVTGSTKRMQSPASPFVAKVRPRSAKDRWAGPAVLGRE